jgi:hypothetical protein
VEESFFPQLTFGTVNKESLVKSNFLRCVITAHPLRARVLTLGLSAAVVLVGSFASAAGLTFTLNQSQSNISLDIKNAQLFGQNLSLSEQATGSLKSSYTGTVVTDIDGSSIDFPGGSAADASILTGGIFKTPVNLLPGVGGTGAAAPGDYGFVLSAPIGQALPPIDLTFLNIPGVTTLNLGTFKAVNLNTTLRDVVLDVTTSTPIPRSGVPALTTFDASQATFGLTGNADVSLAAVLAAGDFLSYQVNGLALAALANLVNAQVPGLLSVNYNPLAIFGPYDISIGLGTRLPLNGLQLPNEDATKLGSLQVVGTNYRMTLPVSFNAIPDFSSLGAASGLLSFLLPLHLGFSGQLVGVAPKIAVPEPGSVVLLGIGLMSLAMVAVKHRRAKK